MAAKSLEGHEALSRDYLRNYLSSIPGAEDCTADLDSSSTEGYAKALHTADPSRPAEVILENSEISLPDLSRLYMRMRDNDAYRALTHSMYYPRRLLVATAESLVEDPYFNAERATPKTLEVHATKGTCDFTCQMCLWSDKKELTYKSKGLEVGGLMTIDDWQQTFSDAASAGTRTIIFSGGGEPLLNKDVFLLSRIARGNNMNTQLYTNGYGFRNATDEDWNEALAMEQIRFSVHSPYSSTYDSIVAMPPKNNTLQVVTDNIRKLVAKKDRIGSATKIGIGFVVQVKNYDQIEDMVLLGHSLGVDFINLRQDEVGVSSGLSTLQQAEIAQQLRSVRERSLNGEFGDMYVDMSDDMTAAANSVTQSLERADECVVKMFRPAISPYGVFSACDLKAEPRFANLTHTFGSVRTMGALPVINALGNKKVDASCTECMPSGRTINAIASKLVMDSALGITPEKQPFGLSKSTR